MVLRGVVKLRSLRRFSVALIVLSAIVFSVSARDVGSGWSGFAAVYAGLLPLQLAAAFYAFLRIKR